jgi:fused signal recognition particle receptor
VSRSLWQRIREAALTDVGVLVRGLDRDTLERFERVMVEADFGPLAFELVEGLEDQLRRGALRTPEAVRAWLRDRIIACFPPDGDRAALGLGDGAGPAVILVLGVNGVGKTTQIAKLAHRFLRQGKRVLLAAADTYRAGASEQLAVWAERLGIGCVSGTAGGDPAAVAYDAVEAAAARGTDVVLVDTAGRLHTQADLMAELQKIARVVGRRRPGAPHESLLVLDGTVGQNALQQGRAFGAAIPITGLVVTKLDGTARGGAVLLLQRELAIPIKLLGVGEGLDDLEDFDPRRFADRLLAE